jgi:5-methylcytosine-specific restriction endonuclease McrA
MRTPEHTQKIIEARRKNPVYMKRWMDMNYARKGTKLTEEHKRKISEAGRGRKMSEATRIRMSKLHKGKIVSLETRAKISLANRGKPKPNRGERNGNWKGGLTPISKNIKNSTEYKDWAKAVKERDNYTCQQAGCGKRGGVLHSDHIKPFALYPELRFDLDNGQTLCEDCHRKKTSQDMKDIRRINPWAKSGRVQK